MRQPHVEFKGLAATRDGELCGYVALRHCQPPEDNVGVIVDLLARREDRACIRTLTLAGVDYFRSIGAAEISTAASVGAYIDVLSSLGFRQRTIVHPMLQAELSTEEMSSLRGEDSWFFSKGDQDWEQYPLGRAMRQPLGAGLRARAKASGKRLVKGLLDRTPLSLCKRILRRDLIGLYYHLVSDERRPHVEHLHGIKSTAEMEADLAFLKARYHICSYEEIVSRYSGGAKLPSNSVVLTFDDGLVECHSIVRGLLKKHGVPAIFFIATDYVDNRSVFYKHIVSLCIDRLLSLDEPGASGLWERVTRDLGISFKSVESCCRWLRACPARQADLVFDFARLLDIDPQQFARTTQPFMSAAQVRDLAADGFTVGAHTMSHRPASELSENEVTHEIAESCRAVRAMTGVASVPFAFPFSGRGVENRTIDKVRSECGELALVFDSRGLRSDRSRINRVDGERLAASRRSESDLPTLLRDAYHRELYRVAGTPYRGRAGERT